MNHSNSPVSPLHKIRIICELQLIEIPAVIKRRGTLNGLNSKGFTLGNSREHCLKSKTQEPGRF